MPQLLKADFGMTRTKENTGKDMRSQINNHLTLFERTFKLEEITGQVCFANGGKETGGLGRTNSYEVCFQQRHSPRVKTFVSYVLHFCCINKPDIAKGGSKQFPAHSKT